MRRFPLLLAVSLAAVLGGCATHAPDMAMQDQTQDQMGLPRASSLPDSHVPAAIPSGYVAFCLRFSDQCELPKNSPAVAHLNPETYDLLTRINRSFNAAIQPEDDAQHYGPSDYWTIATDGYGDCEDYALTKRKALIEAGLPVAALRLAVVLTPAKERHAILTVATDRGDFVMDNFSDQVRPWTDVSYTWLARQDPKTAWRWDMLSEDNSGTASSAATASN